MRPRAPTVSIAPAIDAGLRPSLGYLSLLVARRLDAARWVVIPVDQIFYLFLGSAAANGMIEAPWARRQTLVPNGVYVRTPKGVFRLRSYDSLSAVQRVLDPRWFVPTRSSILVNIRRLSELDLDGRLKQVDLDIGGAVESLRVSRRALPLLCASLGERPGARVRSKRAAAPG